MQLNVFTIKYMGIKSIKYVHLIEFIHNTFKSHMAFGYMFILFVFFCVYSSSSRCAKMFNVNR